MFSEALGRLINVSYPALSDYIRLTDCGGVSFFAYEVDGATNVTVTFGSDAAGTATTTPDVIDHYYGRSIDVSDGKWHRTAVSPASETFAAADGTEDLVCVEILSTMAPDGYPFVKCATDGAGIVFAVVHDLAYPRSPANLRSIIA